MRERGASGLLAPMPARRLCTLVLAAALLAALPASASAASDGADATAKKGNRCPPGTTPVVKKRGRKAVAKRDRRGRLRCRAIPVRRPPAPRAAPLGQAAAAADALREAIAVDPGALARLQRALGRKRARKLLDVSLDGWRRSAGAVTARAAADPETATYSPGAGVDGKVDFGVTPIEGSDGGFSATANATVTATRDGVKGLVPSEKLPADVKSARAELSARFEDRLRGCPAEQGKRPGKVKANGKIKVTLERDGKPPIVMELEADVDATYTATSGEDGKAAKIDDVEVKTTFRTAATGEATQTYRGRRLGTGFGRESILDAGPGSAAIDRDIGHFDSGHGGVAGPKGAWSYERGIGVSDLRSIDNVKAMLTAAVATDLLTLAALEYVRKVALPRADKAECAYRVSMVVNGQGLFATHDATGQFSVEVTPAAAGAGKWSGAVPAAWTSLVFTSKTECPYVDPVSGGTYTVDLALTEAGALGVTWTVDAGGSMSTASVDCPPSDEYDPPPIPGQPGPALAGAGPTTFELPAEGGSQPITGGFQDGGSGFFNDGVLTVTRTR